jgi:hypothetical protein
MAARTICSSPIPDELLGIIHIAYDRRKTAKGL